MSKVLIRDWLFRIGLLTAVHNHEEGYREGYCAGCHEEEARR